MRETFRGHPGLVSVIGGTMFALVMFVVGGSARIDPVSIVLAAILGLAFGGAMYLTARVLRTPPP